MRWPLSPAATLAGGHCRPRVRAGRTSLGQLSMRFWLMASPPPGEFYGGLLFGLLIVAVTIAVLFGQKRSLKWRGLVQLCILTFVVGLLAGAGLAGLALLFGDVDNDRWWRVFCLGMIGFVPGVVCTLLMGVVGTTWILVRAKTGKPQGLPPADQPGG